MHPWSHLKFKKEGKTWSLSNSRRQKMKLHGQMSCYPFLSTFSFHVVPSRMYSSIFPCLCFWPSFYHPPYKGGKGTHEFHFGTCKLLGLNPCTLSNHSNRKEKRASTVVSHGLYFGSTTFTAKTSPFILLLVGSRVIWSTLVMLQESVIAFCFLALSPNSPQYFSFKTDVLLNKTHLSYLLALGLHLFAPENRWAHNPLFHPQS